MRLRRVTAGLVTAALLQAAAPGVMACGPKVEVQFLESDGDVFVVANKSEEAWSIVSLVIQLTGSLGYLVFDTADGGEGANMYTPFGAVSGDVGLVAQPDVADGAEALTLRFRDFPPGRTFMFVIDVDDRLENSDFGQAVVSGSEIAGAAARAELMLPSGASSKAKGVFGPDGKAMLTGGLCT